jgi:hypothetical protein
MVWNTSIVGPPRKNVSSGGEGSEEFGKCNVCYTLNWTMFPPFFVYIGDFVSCLV